MNKTLYQQTIISEYCSNIVHDEHILLHICRRKSQKEQTHRISLPNRARFTLTHSKMVALCLCTACVSTAMAFISMFRATYLKRQYIQ